MHHRLGIALVVEKFGEEARGPAERHIEDDMGFVPETWLDHAPYVFYLDLNEEAKQEEDLVCLYGRETYDRVTAGLAP